MLLSSQSLVLCFASLIAAYYVLEQKYDKNNKNSDDIDNEDVCENVLNQQTGYTRHMRGCYCLRYNSSIDAEMR